MQDRFPWSLVIIQIVTTVIYLASCAPPKAPLKTQLQLRQFQTRSYDTSNTKMVMKAMLNVLYDEGYIVENADVELGLLTAKKSVDIEDAGERFAASCAWGVHARWKKASVMECSANVNEFGEKTKVRIIFQKKILDNKGGIVKLETIVDQNFYQEFFSKVDKGIFLEKEKL